MLSEKDRPILGYLTNIELDLHDDKTTSTEIKWKPNCNPTMMKKKKKRQGKKVNVEVKTDSFFNFFNTIDPEAEDE